MKHLSDMEIREAVAAGLVHPALADFIIGQEETPLNNVLHISNGRPLRAEELKARANYSDPVGVSRKIKNAYANGFKMRNVK